MAEQVAAMIDELTNAEAFCHGVHAAAQESVLVLAALGEDTSRYQNVIEEMEATLQGIGTLLSSANGVLSQLGDD